MKIVGICGKGGSGKDTVADVLVGYGARKLSFAGPLKAMLATIGIHEPATREEKEAINPLWGFSYRQAAQTLGTEWGRSLRPDLWVWITAKALEHQAEHIVFSDVRFENEADVIRKAGGVIWHIKGRQSTVAADLSNHASEKGIALKNGDTVYYNTGSLQDLDRWVAHLWEQVPA